MGWHHRRERGASSPQRESEPLSLERHRDDWDELASTDPLWAILSSPDKRRSSPGHPPARSQQRLGLHLIRMLSVPQPVVRSTMESAGAEVVDVETTRDGGATSAMYWATVRAG
jgi:hypothetical protein